MTWFATRKEKFYPHDLCLFRPFDIQQQIWLTKINSSNYRKLEQIRLHLSG